MDREHQTTLLQEHAGQAVMRLWEAIWDVINADAVQPFDDKSGQAKSYNIDKGAVKSALDRREGRIVQASDFRQRINLLNKAFKAGDKNQSSPLNVKVTTTKSGRLRMIWNVDTQKSLARVVDGNLDIITENYTESDSYDAPLEPFKILVSHAHEDEESEKIKDQFVKKLRFYFENCPKPHHENKWEIIYDKDDVKGTETFPEFIRTHASTAKYAIFLTSDKWRRSEPCREELGYFWDGKERRPGRISLFLEFSNEWEEMGGIANWIKWKFKHRNLLSFWNHKEPDRNNQLIESIRAELLSPATSSKSGPPESVTQQKRIEKDRTFTPGDDPDHTMTYRVQQQKLLEENIKVTGADAYTQDHGERYSLQAMLWHWLKGGKQNKKKDLPALGGRLLVLLGDFGMGKTTNLQYFTRSLLDKRKKDPSLPLPIYLDMRRMVHLITEAGSASPHLQDLIAAGLKLDTPEQDQSHIKDYMNYIRTKPSVVIFDGLDEIGNQIGEPQARLLFQQLLDIIPNDIWIKDSRDSKPDYSTCPTRLMLSCRTHFFRDTEAETAALTGNYRHILSDQSRASLWSRLYLAPFTLNQIKSWLEKNIGTEEGAMAFEKMQEIHDLLGMAERPILLRLINEILPSLATQHQQGGKIKTATIYELVFRRVIERDQPVKKLKMSLAEKQHVLSGLAENLWRRKDKSLSVDRLDDWFAEQGRMVTAYKGDIWVQEREQLLTELYNANLLVREGEKHFRFAHSSFYEYFLARSLWTSLVEGRFDDKPLPSISQETVTFFHELYLLCEETQERIAIIRNLRTILKSPTMPHDNRQFWANLILGGEAIALTDFDFSGLDLRKLHINNREIRECSFSNTTLTGLKIEHVKFDSCDFEGSLMGSGDYRNCIFRNCTGTPAHIESSQFQSCIFDPANSFDKIRFHRDCAGLTLSSPSAPGKLYFSTGHEVFVNSAVFSPDGQYILTASADQTARLWEKASGRHIMTYRGHEDWVISAVFSPDGQYILTASDDNTAQLWETASGKNIMTYHGHEGWVRSAVFSPDGEYILTASHDNTARLWERESGKEIMTYHGHEGWVRSAVFSPDGNHILTASDDNTARLWDRSSGKEIMIYHGHKSWVRSAVFSPDGKHILTASRDHTARLWERSSGKQIMTYRGHEEWVRSAVFSPDGNYILTASDDQTARLWEKASGKHIMTYHGHKDDLNSAVFSPDGNHILTASNDRTARLWDRSSGKELITYRGHEDWVRSVAFSPDGQYILTASDDNTARLWETASGKNIITYRGHERSVRSAVFSPDGQHILTASFDGTARLWETASGRHIMTYHGHKDDVNSAVFSPDGNHILTASDDNTARLWETASGKNIMIYRGHGNSVKSAVFSPDAQHILTASADKTARLWDRSSGKEIMIYRGHEDWVNSAVFSPDGEHILTLSFDETARLWEKASGREIKSMSLEEGEELMKLWGKQTPPTPRKESLDYQGGHFSLHDADGSMLWQSWHLDEGWVAVNEEGEILRASPEAWPYIIHIVPDKKTGLLKAYPAQTHPDWDKLTRDNKDT